jgi:hypothetical protein
MFIDNIKKVNLQKFAENENKIWKLEKKFVFLCFIILTFSCKIKKQNIVDKKLEERIERIEDYSRTNSCITNKKNLN